MRDLKMSVMQKIFGDEKNNNYFAIDNNFSCYLSYSYLNMNAATLNWPAIQWISYKLSALSMSVSASSSDQYLWPLISWKPPTASIKAKPHGDKARVWKKMKKNDTDSIICETQGKGKNITRHYFISLARGLHLIRNNNILCKPFFLFNYYHPLLCH